MEMGVSLGKHMSFIVSDGKLEGKIMGWWTVVYFLAKSSLNLNTFGLSTGMSSWEFQFDINIYNYIQENKINK